MNTKKIIILLSLTLVCGALLRFWGLNRRGLMIWDEAYYSLEGGTVPHAVSGIIAGGAAGVKERLVQGGSVLPTGTGKPAFMLLLSCWGTIFGTSDFAGLSMTAAAGVLCIWLVFLAASSCAGAEAGLAAAFLLAFSGLHVWYSRAMLSNSIAAAAFTGALLVYLRAAATEGAGRRLFFMAGAAFGAAFMIHYMLLPNLAVLALCEVLRLAGRRERLKAEALNSLALLAGLVAALCVTEAVTRAVYFAFSGRLAGIAHLTYFQYLGRQFIWNAPSDNHVGWAWRFYLSGLAEFLGRPAAALYLFCMLCSVPVFIKERSLAVRVFLLQTWATLIFWLLCPGVAAMRATASLAPLGAVTAAASAVLLLRGRGRALRVSALCAGAAAALAGAAAVLPEMLAARSFYPEAASWLEARGEKDPVALLEWPFLQFYLGNKIQANNDRLGGAIDEAGKFGSKYLVITNTEKDWIRGNGSYPGLLEALGSLRPEASWRLGAGGGFLAYDGLYYPQHISEAEAYPVTAVAAAMRRGLSGASALRKR